MSSHTKLLYHIVFSTKDRRPMIAAGWNQQLYQYIGGVIRGERGVLIEIGGMPDHIHILAKFRADVSVAEMLRRIKANSSKWINEQAKLRGRFAWQNGYAAFNVSESQVEALKRYIQGQVQHHRRRSFQDEFVMFLEKHRIDYDKRYLWT